MLASWKSDTQKAGDLLRQAVEVDPTNAIVLSMQADYLEHVRRDMDAADQVPSALATLALRQPHLRHAHHFSVLLFSLLP